MKKAVLQNNPTSLNLFFTGKCNLNCRYCFVDKAGEENRTLDERSLKKSVDLLFANPRGRKTISFIGGEPALEFALIKKTHHYAKKIAQKAGIYVDFIVSTNGTLLNQKMVDYFSKQGIAVSISIDGDKITHDWNRPFRNNPGRSSFNAVMKNIKRLKFGSLRPAAAMVFTPADIKKLMANIEFLHKKNFSAINFYPDMHAKWSAKDILLLRSELKKFEYYYLDTFLESGAEKPFKNSFLDAMINSSKIKKLEKCEKLNVDSGGNLYACDKVFSLKVSQRKRYMVGSVTSGIDNQKRSAILRNITKQILKNTGLRCEKCPYYQYCFCPAGHYIYLLDHPVKDDRKYWANHCSVSLAYIETFLNIKKLLRKNRECGKMYA
jgi:uncharacterized protein